MAVVVMETAGNRYKIHRVLTPDGKTFKVLKQAKAEVNTVGGVTEGAKSSGEVAPTINSASDNSINNPAENVNSEKWVPYYELSAQELVQAQIEGRYDENTKMVLLEMPNSQAVENGEAEFALGYGKMVGKTGSQNLTERSWTL